MPTLQPVTRASFRLATTEEVQQAQGGIAWKCIQCPTNLLYKIMGTAEICWKGPNILAWNTPYPQQWIGRVTHWLGFNEEINFMDKLFSFMGDRYLLHDKVTIKALFEHHRNSEMFINSNSFRTFLNILKETFPEEEFPDESFLLTCSPAQTAIYRGLLHNLLNLSSIKNFQNQIKNTAHTFLTEWENQAESINVTHQTRLFASSIITQLMFGNDESSETLAEAINFTNIYIIKLLTHQLTQNEKDQFKEYMTQFKTAIENVLNRQETIPLFENSTLTLSEKKAMIFGVFFAGQETTASLLNYMIWQLAKNPDKQTNLYSILTSDNEEEAELALHNFFSESIKEFTPAYGVSRKVNKAVCLEYELQDKPGVFKTIFYPNQLIIARIASLAQNSEKDSHPHNWFSFGDGPHACPGKYLAKKEIITFLSVLIADYEVTTTQMGEIPKEGLVTLQLAEDIYINLQRRDPVQV